jgi:hypothetical protein
MQVTILSDSDERIHIEAEITRGQAGIRGLYGQRETPDDEDDIEITEALDDAYRDVELSSAEHERAIEAVIEEMQR